MPVLKIKNSRGEWEDIATANTHQHTISDITDLPVGIASEVETLKNKVGAMSVAQQVDMAIKANVYTHPDTHSASMITGLAPVATSGSFNDLKDVPENLGGANLVLEDIVIFEEKTMDFNYLSFYNTHVAVVPFGENAKKFPLNLGDECVVVWEGVEYEVTVKDSSAVTEGTLYMGNGTPMNLPGSGEPFAIGFDETGATFVSLEELAQDQTGTYTVKIYQTPKVQILPEVTESDNGKVLGVVGGTWGKMDLPEGSGATSEGLPKDFLSEQETLTEMLPSTELQFFENDAFGAYVGIALLSEEDYLTWNAYEGNVRVVWDGTVYDMQMQLVQGMAAVGNLTAYGGSGNDEPFMVSVIKEANETVEGGYEYILMVAEFTTEASHTVQISLVEETQKIKEEYIPDIPEFDLAAMGLPNVPIDGTEVSVECDITEIKEAMAKGLVKFKANMDAGQMVLSMEAVAAPMYTSQTDAYSVSFLAAMGVPVMGFYQIFDGQIIAKVFTLATTD